MLNKSLEEENVEYFSILYGKKHGKNVANEFARFGYLTFKAAAFAFAVSIFSFFGFVQHIFYFMEPYVKIIPRFDSDLLQLKMHFGEIREPLFLSIYSFIIFYTITFSAYAIFRVAKNFFIEGIIMDLSCFSDWIFRKKLVVILLFTCLMYYFYFSHSIDHTEVENLSKIGGLYATGLIWPFEFLASSMIVVMLYMYVVYITTFLGGLFLCVAKRRK